MCELAFRSWMSIIDWPSRSLEKSGSAIAICVWRSRFDWRLRFRLIAACRNRFSDIVSPMAIMRLMDGSDIGMSRMEIMTRTAVSDPACQAIALWISHLGWHDMQMGAAHSGTDEMDFKVDTA